jgi:uncharacterized protein YdhG (YjbR/CyaY superfamily)
VDTRTRHPSIPNVATNAGAVTAGQNPLTVRRKRITDAWSGGDGSIFPTSTGLSAPVRRGTIARMTSRPAATQHLRDLALLRRGNLSVAEVCVAVGCSSLSTFSARFTELVGAPPSVDRRRAVHASAVMPSCVAKKEATMAKRKPANTGTQQSARSTTGKVSRGFTDEERAAMKERAQELKAEARANKDKAEGERAVLAKIAEMPEPDRSMGERLHAIITASAPALSPRTWYGMPAYARDGKVVCFFQSAEKFKSRYATFGFSDEANLDDGAMWPTSLALKELTTAGEARIAALVKKAVS